MLSDPASPLIEAREKGRAPEVGVRYASGMEFKDNLARELDAAGLTQLDLAGKLHISASAVSQWATGATLPGQKRLRQIADALDIPVESLVSGVRSENAIRQKIAKAKLPSQTASSAGGADGMRVIVPTLPDPDALTRDIPIFGTLLFGGMRMLNFRGGPASVALRQPGLVGRQGVFGFYMPDGAMSPWREAGEVVFVQRGRPAVVGQYAVAARPDAPTVRRSVPVRTATASPPLWSDAWPHGNRAGSP